MQTLFLLSPVFARVPPRHGCVLRFASVAPSVRLGVLLVVVCGVFPGCSGSRRTLSPREQLDYKLSVMRRNEAQLTAPQRAALVHHPGRSRAAIDDAVSDMMAANDALERAAHARLRVGDRYRVYEARSPYYAEGTQPAPLTPKAPTFAELDRAAGEERAASGVVPGVDSNPAVRSATLGLGSVGMDSEIE